MSGATESFCDWHDRSTSVSRQKFCFDWFKRSTSDRWWNRFSDSRERGKNDHRPKFCAWPDRKFFWLVRTKQKSSRIAVFCNWGDWSTSDRRPKRFASIATENFSTGVTEAKFTADRSLFAIGANVVQLTAHRNFFATEVTAARMNADQSVFATGASENFCDWRVRRKISRRLKFFWLARVNYMWPLTDSFCAWRDWKFLRLARPK